MASAAITARKTNMITDFKIYTYFFLNLASGYAYLYGASWLGIPTKFNTSCPGLLFVKIVCHEETSVV